MDGLNILMGAFHLDPRQGYYPGSQIVTRKSGEGIAAVSEEKKIAAIRYIRFAGEKSEYSVHGDSPIFVYDHGTTSFFLS